MNWLRTTLLLGLLTGLLIFVGYAIGGQTGMIIAFIIAMVMNFGSYWFSDKIVLRAYGAKQVGPNEAPELYSIVKQLAHQAQLPMPKVYIVDNPTPNAFATGRNPQNAAVAATTGILNILDSRELKGVFAHELSHVYHRDTLISAIAATIGGAIAVLANMAQWAMIFGGRSDDGEGGGGIIGSLLMIILAPIAAMLIQMAVSRTREYAADKRGAKLSGDPMALASALQKLEAASQQIPMQAAETHPATAHMFIVNPLTGQTLKHLFSTHPPTAERVKRLKEMARHTQRM
ncbi:MAG: zinc metalloprotease HtpX [Pseudomonadota bacterium]